MEEQGRIEVKKRNDRGAASGLCTQRVEMELTPGGH